MKIRNVKPAVSPTEVRPREPGNQKTSNSLGHYLDRSNWDLKSVSAIQAVRPTEVTLSKPCNQKIANRPERYLAQSKWDLPLVSGIQAPSRRP